MPDFDTRVGAYGLIVQGGRVLLTHWTGGLSGSPGWTLPGGGLEAGEEPPAAAVREILEETGLTVELGALLGLDSRHFAPSERADGMTRPLLSLRVIYLARIVAGSLRSEMNGSTDEASWFDLTAVPSLKRVELVDVALRWWQERRSV